MSKLVRGRYPTRIPDSASCFVIRAAIRLLVYTTFTVGSTVAPVFSTYRLLAPRARNREGCAKRDSCVFLTLVHFERGELLYFHGRLQHTLVWDRGPFELGED